MSRQVAKSMYVDGMGSAPNSPCENYRSLLDSRSSSPTLSNRSVSPSVVRNRRSQSTRSDDSSKAIVRQTKSSTIRRANSMLVSSVGSPSLPSVANNLRTARRSSRGVQRSESTLKSTHGARCSRNLDLINNNTENKDVMQRLPGKRRPVTIGSA